MIDVKRISYLKDLIRQCKDVIDSPSSVYRGKNEADGSVTFGIEYEDFQTLHLTVRPLFDIDEKKLHALISLMAHGVPALNGIIGEMEAQQNKIEMLLQALSTVVLVTAEHHSEVLDEIDYEILDDSEHGEMGGR